MRASPFLSGIQRPRHDSEEVLGSSLAGGSLGGGVWATRDHVWVPLASWWWYRALWSCYGVWYMHNCALSGRDWVCEAGSSLGADSGWTEGQGRGSRRGGLAADLGLVCPQGRLAEAVGCEWARPHWPLCWGQGSARRDRAERRTAVAQTRGRAVWGPVCLCGGFT